jgi:hypothetical protein
MSFLDVSVKLCKDMQSVVMKNVLEKNKMTNEKINDDYKSFINILASFYSENSNVIIVNEIAILCYFALYTLLYKCKTNNQFNKLVNQHFTKCKNLLNITANELKTKIYKHKLYFYTRIYVYKIILEDFILQMKNNTNNKTEIDKYYMGSLKIIDILFKIKKTKEYSLCNSIKKITDNLIKFYFDETTKYVPLTNVHLTHSVFKNDESIEKPSRKRALSF